MTQKFGFLVMHPTQAIHLNATRLPVLVRGLTERDTKALRSAWLKGFHAALVGKKREDNPYSDERTYRGGVTFSRAFLRSWDHGRVAGEEHLRGG